ncbi:hypothetical protein C1645_748386 [Glomus cerebriforme]|uniref:MYND-type domain-containing protein n=1 Tax=Glomus cerebriforme TaxID=658196 RepID=A0A397TLE9_9GLOM|nr:hypothetical protein C1645_748386 [Glomus cerebriforme]
MRSCLNALGVLLNNNKGKIDKPVPVNFRTLVPQDFVEEDISGPSCSSSSSEIKDNRISIFNLSRKKGALPPVVSQVTTLLNEAESKASSKDFAKSVELLEKATTLGSACAAAKLGLVYHGGIRSTVEPDYSSAAAYYLLALKLIYMIPSDKWDLGLLLEVIAGLSEIYRKKMRRDEDNDIWMSGIRAMRHVENSLQDPAMIRNFKHRELQKSKAIRVHMNYCFGLTSETDEEYQDAIKFYENCKRIGESNFATADKLVKKAQSKIKELKSKVPTVKPICVSCDYEPKELTDIWKLLVCSKCRVVAACSRECLTTHLATHATHATRS